LDALPGNNKFGGVTHMKNISKSESVFKKKGFYIALYSCIGVVLLLAAVISYYGIEGPEIEPDGNPIAAVENEEEAAEMMNPQTKAQIPADNYIPPLSDTSLAVAPPPEILTPTVSTPAQTPSDLVLAENPVPPDLDAKPDITAAAEPAAENTQNAANVEKVDVVTEKASAFTAFEDSQTMEWPALGEIVMDYSPEHVVYDVTLEHYRTNDTICIAAQPGTQVKASAEGVVKEITATREKGNSVVIDHGNGWETTYSQLQDQLLVAEGDVVETGDVIGGVGNPSIYSVLLGNHLEFSVSKEDVGIDPKMVLAQAETAE
jgi:murein DD-endopeptidase MepM/ murein hydrolase activator NlpD